MSDENHHPKPFRLRECQLVRKGALRARVNLTCTPLGLDIDDVAIFEKGSRRWANLPGRPMLDRDGTVLRDERGRIRYASPIRWLSHDLSAKFSERVVGLIEAEHPEVFADPEPPRADPSGFYDDTIPF